MRLLAVLLLLLAAPAAAQPAMTEADRDRWADSARRAIETATTTGDRARIVAARAIAERALAAFPDDPLLLHYRGYALWREASLLLGTGDPRASRPQLQEAERALERSARTLALPETFALHASVLGQLIGTSRNPFDGMRMGPRSNSLMERAETLAPRNPRVWLLRGISAMYAPAMFGGGLDKAESHLQRAIALFESDAPAAPLPAWGRAEAHAYMGQVLARRGRRDAARAAYERALALQPEYGWVRQVLLPALDRPTS